MRICLLGDNGSVHVQKWVHALAKENEIELHVIAFDRGVKFEGAIYHYLKPFFNNKLDYFFNVSLLKRLIEEIKPDLLHAHYATSYGYMGARTNFHPYIITGWGSDIFDSPKNILMKMILKYSLKKADAVSVLTDITQKEIKKLTNKKIELIPFGVDVELFTNKNNDGKTDSYFRIGAIRTLSAKYGIEYLIRAFALLHTKYDNIRLEIVGDGDQRLYLEQLAKELNIEEKTRFYGYISQTKDIKTYMHLLQGFDVFVIPSILDSETFGVAAVEAMACSLPVVATNIGGLPEVVDDNETGILVPVKNAKAIADALEKLIVDTSLRKYLGDNGRIKVEKNFDWKMSVEKMKFFYQSVLNTNRNT